MKSVLISLLFCVAVLGQTDRVPFPFLTPYQDLKQYLLLAESQYQGLLSNQSNYDSLVYSKQRRVAQVSAEIAAETARENLDAMGLGVRYLELEVNCREMKDAFAKLRTQNLALLNDAQKVKLKALEDALKLSSVIVQAQQVNLADNTLVFPSVNVVGSSSGLGAFLLGGPTTSSFATFPGCRTPAYSFIYDPLIRP